MARFGGDRAHGPRTRGHRRGEASGPFPLGDRALETRKAWCSGKSVAQNAPAYVNAARGRRVGDGVWRTQLRLMLAGTDAHSAEFMLDLHKAFELVCIDLLVEAAVKAG